MTFTNGKMVLIFTLKNMHGNVKIVQKNSIFRHFVSRSLQQIWNYHSQLKMRESHKVGEFPLAFLFQLFYVKIDMFHIIIMIAWQSLKEWKELHHILSAPSTASSSYRSVDLVRSILGSSPVIFENWLWKDLLLCKFWLLEDFQWISWWNSSSNFWHFSKVSF